MWTMLCPGSLWMSKQHVLPSLPGGGGVVVLWSHCPGGLYNFYWMPLQTHSIFNIFIEQETGGTWLFPDRKCTLPSAAFVRSLSLHASFHTECLPAHGGSLMNTHTYTLTDIVTLATTVSAHQLWGHGPVWPPQFVLTHCSWPWAGCYLWQ